MQKQKNKKAASTQFSQYASDGTLKLEAAIKSIERDGVNVPSVLDILPGPKARTRKKEKSFGQNSVSRKKSDIAFTPETEKVSPKNTQVERHSVVPGHVIIPAHTHVERVGRNAKKTKKKTPASYSLDDFRREYPVEELCLYVRPVERFKRIPGLKEMQYTVLVIGHNHAMQKVREELKSSSKSLASYISTGEFIDIHLKDIPLPQ